MINPPPTHQLFPVVDVIYLHPTTHAIHHKYIRWNHSPDLESLELWILDYYYDRVSDGYLPTGHSIAPKPHAARIYQAGFLLAEWLKPRRHKRLSPVPSAESPVTAEIRTGPGGIRAVVPSTTNSGVRVLESPKLATGLPSSYGYFALTAVNDAGGHGNNFGVDQVSSPRLPAPKPDVIAITT